MCIYVYIYRISQEYNFRITIRSIYAISPSRFSISSSAILSCCDNERKLAFEL